MVGEVHAESWQLSFTGQKREDIIGNALTNIRAAFRGDQHGGDGKDGGNHERRSIRQQPTTTPATSRQQAIFNVHLSGNKVSNLHGDHEHSDLYGYHGHNCGCWSCEKQRKSSNMRSTPGAHVSTDHGHRISSLINDHERNRINLSSAQTQGQLRVDHGRRVSNLNSHRQHEFTSFGCAVGGRFDYPGDGYERRSSNQTRRLYPVLPDQSNMPRIHRRGERNHRFQERNDRSFQPYEYSRSRGADDDTEIQTVSLYV